MVLITQLSRLPPGYSIGSFNGIKYGITKTTFNHGKSIKVYAEALNGSDFISLNYYVTDQAEWLKPCEMPEAKVLDFLAKVVIIN